MTEGSKASICSAVHLVAASAIYGYLITGGWLTNHYDLHDPNIVNLALAIFEPMTILSVIAYWIWRGSRLYRILFALTLVQVLIGIGFLAFVIGFALLWHPKMM